MYILVRIPGNFYHTNIGIFLQLLLKVRLLLNLFVFPHVHEFFQLMNVILKILNSFNKSNYLLQQYYFNHFQFI